MAFFESVKLKDADGNVTTPANDESLTLLRRIFQLLKPLGLVTSGSNRLNIDINSVTSLPTLGTVTTVNQLGGITTFELMKAMSRQAYNSGIRANIS